MTDHRLIESAFPLKQTSLDAVHEKNVRHGHISTLHIWPARRPLAACRAALLAILLPDPETPAERQALCELIGGTVRQTVRKGVVKKEGGGFVSIGDFLIHVRRFVVDFVVGRVLLRDNADGASAAAESLDALTAYYLLHRHDFGFEPAPIGQVILYGQSCGLSDRDLVQTWDLLVSPKTAAAEASDDEDATEEDTDVAQSGGATVKLKAWNQRKEKSLGYEAPGGRSLPLIDRIHRLMQLWKAGHVAHVDEYLDANGLRQQELCKRLLQALIELALAGSEERAVLENLSNHIGVKIAKPESKDLLSF